VGVTVREQEEVASLQPERLPAIPFQEATSLRHDMKLGPAGRLRFVHGVPLRSKPAHFHADRINEQSRPYQGPDPFSWQCRCMPCRSFRGLRLGVAGGRLLERRVGNNMRCAAIPNKHQTGIGRCMRQALVPSDSSHGGNPVLKTGIRQEKNQRLWLGERDPLTSTITRVRS
jgi:hypothetical protein